MIYKSKIIYKFKAIDLNLFKLNEFEEKLKKIHEK